MKKKDKFTKKRVREKVVRKITNGVFSSVIDMVLFAFYLFGSSFGKKANSRDIYKTFSEAEALIREVNYETFKRAIAKLKERGFIESIKRWTVEPVITEKGKRRLQSIFPFYDTERVWDGNLYLINYDIKTKFNVQRNLLREILRKIGATRLAESLYITPYNPEQILNNFLKEHHFEGTVLISYLGKGGFLGEESLKEFLWRTANLETVNQRYREFIKKYKNIKKYSRLELSAEYFSILRDDPQLPFALLPDDYLGDEAYLLYTKLSKIT